MIMKMTTNRTKGFTLVELMIVVALIGLVAAIAVPTFVTSRINSRKNTCIANLRQIENAKQVWANEGNKNGGSQASATDLFGPDKYLRAKPACPSGGQYSIEIVDEKPKCTYGPIEGHIL
jgi:prepilin-type N-terminal cleavage/methylation domain-containing protein